MSQLDRACPAESVTSTDEDVSREIVQETAVIVGALSTGMSTNLHRAALHGNSESAADSQSDLLPSNPSYMQRHQNDSSL